VDEKGLVLQNDRSLKKQYRGVDYDSAQKNSKARRRYLTITTKESLKGKSTIGKGNRSEGERKKKNKKYSPPAAREEQKNY